MKSENYLKDIGLSLFACFVLIFFAFLGQAHCQVPVSPAPEAHLQFLDSSGKPLAAGRIFTYSAGTTTLLNTYAEGTGTFANPDPIILDAGGYANIWLANASYKFVVQNSLGVQQWVVDNLSGYLGLTALNNIWSGTNTYSQPIVISPVDNQIVLGATGTQTTLDFPPPSGNVFLHFPITTDWMVGRDTTDTLTHKTLASPFATGNVQVNGKIVIVASSGGTPNKWLQVDGLGTFDVMSSNDANTLFEVAENGTTTFHGHLQNSSTGLNGGHCTMAAGTSCTFALSGGPFNSTPICVASVQSVTVIAGSCALSAGVVTITAAGSNSSTWGAVLFGDPN